MLGFSIVDGLRRLGPASRTEWLEQERKTAGWQGLEMELGKVEKKLEASPPLPWEDRMLWRGVRWLYQMRLRGFGGTVERRGPLFEDSARMYNVLRHHVFPLVFGLLMGIVFTIGGKSDYSLAEWPFGIWLAWQGLMWAFPQYRG